MSSLAIEMQRVFPAEFARFGGTLDVAEPGAVPLSALLQPAGMQDVTMRYAAGFPGADRRAVLSMWSQHYLLALMPPAIAAALALGRDLPLGLAGMGARLDGCGQATGLCVPHAGCPCVDLCPAARLTPLLRTHLEPLAAELARAGLPPRVLWSNAGAVLSWTIGVIAVAPGVADAVAAAAACERWVDGRPNPFSGVLSRCAGCALGRRVCCLRYRLGGVPACADCPRLSRHVLTNP